MELVLEPTLPFNFDLSAEIFSDGDERIRKYQAGKFWQVLIINGKLVLVCLRYNDETDKPALLFELESESDFSCEDVQTVRKTISLIFNLNLDLKPFYKAAKGDEVMKRITNKLHGLRNPTTPTVFEALVDSITEQQISLKVAESLENRMIKKFGSTLTIGNAKYYAYPTPKELTAAGVDRLRACGLSLRKAEYIENVSKLIIDGKIDLEKLKRCKDSVNIIEALDSIRGIGVWTAEMTMVRGMQKLDALPADDLGLRRIISHYYADGKKITSEQVRRIAEKWGIWRGLASYYLVVAEIMGIR